MTVIRRDFAAPSRYWSIEIIGDGTYNSWLIEEAYGNSDNPLTLLVETVPQAKQNCRDYCVADDWHSYMMTQIISKLPDNEWYHQVHFNSKFTFSAP